MNTNNKTPRKRLDNKKPTNNKVNGKTNNNNSSNNNKEKEERPLTDKQGLFVSEYLIDFNGTQAAIRAGYSRNGADVIASELLRKVKIKALIQEKSREMLADRSALAAKTVRHLEAVGDSDITNYIILGKRKNQVTQLVDMDGVDTRSIASIEVNEKVQKDYKGNPTNVFDRVVKIRLWDKTKSLDTLTKVTGLQSSELKLSGSLTLNFDLQGFKEKVKKELLGDQEPKKDDSK